MATTGTAQPRLFVWKTKRDEDELLRQRIRELRLKQERARKILQRTK